MTGKPLTDAEVLASFMECRPAPLPLNYRRWLGNSPDGWWFSTPIFAMESFWRPSPISLNECHNVEARLTPVDWLNYVDALLAAMPQKFPRKGEVIHATSEQKIAALAAVLRPLVEGAAGRASA